VSSDVLVFMYYIAHIGKIDKFSAL